MIFSFWWSSEPLMTSASGEQLLRRVLLMASASSEPLVFRTSFLQTLQASFFVEFIVLICSSRTYTWIKDTKFLSMVLHTWTNISISNWHILIPCYHQNSKVSVKHTLFQQNRAKMLEHRIQHHTWVFVFSNNEANTQIPNNIYIKKIKNSSRIDI